MGYASHLAGHAKAVVGCTWCAPPAPTVVTTTAYVPQLLDHLRLIRHELEIQGVYPTHWTAPWSRIQVVLDYWGGLPWLGDGKDLLDSLPVAINNDVDDWVAWDGATPYFARVGYLDDPAQTGWVAADEHAMASLAPPPPEPAPADLSQIAADLAAYRAAHPELPDPMPGQLPWAKANPALAPEGLSASYTIDEAVTLTPAKVAELFGLPADLVGAGLYPELVTLTGSSPPPMSYDQAKAYLALAEMLRQAVAMAAERLATMVAVPEAPSAPHLAGVRVPVVHGGQHYAVHLNLEITKEPTP